jgi:hypothetical protein
MDKLINQKRIDISYNTKVKEFPNYYEYTVSSREDFFLPSGYEEKNSGENNLTKVKQNGSTKNSEESLRRSHSRAKRSVREIAACSSFTHFITLTIDKEKLNRYDYGIVIKKVNNLFSNLVARKNFTYVIIPEFHKDGAIHFHGLCKGNLKFIESGHKTKDNKKIYNMQEWKFGFSACIQISGDYEKICNYITKYITKDAKKIGGRWYLSGGKIERPKIGYAELNYREIETKEYYIPQARVSFKYMRIPKEAETI